MSQLLVYYVGYVFVPAFIAFCIVWRKQRASLPASLGPVRLLGVFASVWSSAIATFAVFHITTVLAGYDNLSALEGAYALLASVVGFKIGMIVSGRMLRKMRTQAG